TSHFLGQNFAKAFDVKFTTKQGVQDFVWATSWGVSTRLMGALVMAHSDDDGLVLPPKLAPIQVVIVPIYKNDEQLKLVTDIALKIKKALTARGIAVVYDDDEQAKPGWKFAEYEMKGVPVRLAIGPRDVESGTVELARRDTKEKMTVQITDIELKIENLLEQIQQNIFKKAVDFRETSTHVADSMDEFIKILDTKGGFVFAHWDGTAETEEKIKEQTKATIRCIPLNNKQENGKCILTGKPSTQRVLFARAY
ncbi:MAG TPA: His/Gly/Thr/Pro-type tRNA ligase C-terminal domain-containing protein, partial [Bacteroidia bacterium]|nr:His/Gly/Thr/Pro-type tRNA ligase C-terminal domain-containing protein [Bacteroidia bacterium]